MCPNQVRSLYKRTKDRAWKYFSLYIRTRDCIKTSNGFKDQGACVTCGDFFPIGELQAGHAIAGRNNSILFDERLVNAQCRGCNGYGGGKPAEYSVWYIKRYGEKDWEKKVALSHTERKYTTVELDEIAKKYKLKYERLVK